MSKASSNGWIVDASVALKWFLPTGTEADTGLARKAVGLVPLRTSSLAFYEAGNTLARLARMPPEVVRQSLETMAEICGPPIELEPDDFSASAEIARRHQITFYDASYVAIARRLSRGVLSADSDLLTPGLAVDLQTALD